MVVLFVILGRVVTFIGCQDQSVDNTVNLCAANVSYLPSIFDNCNATWMQTSGSLLPGVFPVGRSLTVFRAVDLSNNSAQCTVNVRVSDVQAPSIG